MSRRTVLSRRLCAALEAHLDGGRALAPEGTSTLWNAFMALSRARSCGLAGPNPISYPEIEAYSRLMRLPFDPRHVEALVAMDQAWIAHAYANASKAKGATSPLTPMAFDAAIG